MEWTLVSYTEIERPLAPYVSVHVVGIVESEEGKRAIARINPHGLLRIGMKGELIKTDHGALNVFQPAQKQ
jgi:uncharacterized OB-fold protein